MSDSLTKFREIWQQLPDVAKLNWEENFTIDFTHNSTTIEGNTLSLLENKIIIEENITPNEAPLRDVLEVYYHAKAWDFVKNCVRNNTPITESIIKDIHEEIYPIRGFGGIYRNFPVNIKAASFVPPNYIKIPELMKNLVYTLDNFNFKNPVHKAAWLHAEFVKIHPFGDGNGRTARLLMNYSLLNDNYPPISIKKGDSLQYFDTLDKYAYANDLEPFKSFVNDAVNKTLEDFIAFYGEPKKELDNDEVPK